MKLAQAISMTIAIFVAGLTIKAGNFIPQEKNSEVTTTVIEDETPLRVHFIDVGQGDCELIESDGEFMLIDCGEREYSDEVIDYLNEQGATTLKYVIATHPHSDHIGGMADVISQVNVENIIMPDKVHTTMTFENMLLAIEKKGLEITLPNIGDIYSLGEGDFEIISPYGDDDNLNNASVGIKLRHGNNSFVMCGDAESDMEYKIAQRDISCNVLKLNHHGSSTSNSDYYLDAASPETVVISCGKDNSYGHPHRETLEKINKRGLELLRTDELGTIIFESDGTRIAWHNLGVDN